MKTIASFFVAGGSALLSVIAQAADSPVARPWKAQDSVGVTYYSVSQSVPEAWYAPEIVADPVVMSPNRKYFFVLSHAGVLATDSNRYRLQIYNLEQLISRLANPRERRTPEPAASFVIDSYSSVGAPVLNARWAADGHSVLFHSNQTSSGGKHELVRLDAESAQVTLLATSNREFDSFDASAKGVLYKQTIRPDFPAQYPVDPAARYWNFGTYQIITDVWRQTLEAKRLVSVSYDLRAAVGLNGDFLDTWLSPAGDQAILLENTGAREGRFVLANLERAQLTPMKGGGIVGRHFFYRSKAAWSPTGERVLLMNTGLPETGGDASAVARGEANLVVYVPATNRWQLIEPMTRPSGEIKSMRWIDADTFSFMRLGADGKQSLTTYTHKADRWSEAGTRSDPAGRRGLPNGLSVFVKQDRDHPPILTVKLGKRELALTVPDEALKGVTRASMTPFQWREVGDKAVSGGLILPPHYNGGRLPLVIQAYNYAPDFFLPDGTHSTTAAAQVLAAHGFAVLQIDLETDEKGNAAVPNEGTGFVQRIDAAVEALSKAGYVDAEKIGLVGFSRSGYQSYFAATHPGRTKLRAVICADSFTKSYTRYLVEVGRADRPRDFEVGPGGSFWANKEAWLNYETSFNVDKVEAPILFTINGSGLDWRYSDAILETIGAFKLNNKPMEYLYFPAAEHLLQRPMERIMMMEAIVDWMEFWLKNEEDPQPHKAGQYTRWRVLRSMKPVQMSEVQK